jgi:quinol monooxygenase YgiN
MIAEFEVPTSNLDKFLAAAQQEIKAVRANEPDCLRFDVLVFDEDKGRGAFIGVFADQEAFDKHGDYVHFKEFFSEIDDFDVTWTVRRGNAIA